MPHHRDHCEVAPMCHPTQSYQFHCFPRLPTELRRLIWELYHEDKPRVRHLFVQALTGPKYAAVDITTGRFVDTVVRDGQQPDPLGSADPCARLMSHPVPLSGPVHVARAGSPLCGDWPGSFWLEPERHVEPFELLNSPTVRVDFERDILHFGPSNPHTGSADVKRHLDFLDPGMTCPAPDDGSLVVNGAHWFSQIRHIALEPPTPYGGSAYDFDPRWLAQLPLLKTISLVASTMWKCKPLDQAAAHSDGFMPVLEWVHVHGLTRHWKPRPNGSTCWWKPSCLCQVDAEEACQFQTTVTALLRSYGRSSKVDIVVDPCLATVLSRPARFR